MILPLFGRFQKLKCNKCPPKTPSKIIFTAARKGGPPLENNLPSSLKTHPTRCIILVTIQNIRCLLWIGKNRPLPID